MLGVAFGFLTGDWFWGTFAYVGISWIVAGAFLKLVERDLTEGAFLAGLVFGVIGAIVWVVIDISRSPHSPDFSNYEDRHRYYKRVPQEDYKCCNCVWFGDPDVKEKKPCLTRNPAKTSPAKPASFIGFGFGIRY